jgi:AcrR family transcriptional regulator
LHAAAEEFARAGFEAASYNHIIDRAKISKGAMYYYFEDKEDLYITVVRRAIERIVDMFDVVPDAADPETHWHQTQQIYLRTLGLLQADPSAAALALGYVRTRPQLRRASALDDVYARARSWLERILRSGQQIGAVRTDLPIGFLVAMLYALADTTDNWVAAHWDEFSALGPDALDQIASKLGDLVRRIAAP